MSNTLADVGIFVFTVVVLAAGAYLIFGSSFLHEGRQRFRQARARRAEIHAASLREADERRRAEEVRRRGRESGFQVDLLPDAVIDGTIEWITRSNYGIESRTSNAVTFAREMEADGCLGCFLLVFFIVPGILYFLLAKGTMRVTVAAYPYQGGSRVVVGGDDEITIRGLEDWIRGLATIPTRQKSDPSQPEVVKDQPEPMQPTSSIASKLRELNELRETGLITQEEYEAKRAELLKEL